MLLKSSSRNPSPIGLNIKRIISKTPTNLKIHSPTLKKKFTPTVNKSFTCYKEKIQSKHQRASSFERSKENLGNVRKSKNRSFRFTSKILQNPKEVSLDQIKQEMETGNYEKALSLLSNFPKLEDSGELLYSRGVCFMHIKNYKQAIEDFHSLIEKDPNFDPQVYIALYMSYVSTNQLALSLKYISKGLRRFPGFLQGHLLRGQLLNRLKKYEKATKDFKKVIAADRSQHLAYFYLAESYAGLKEWEMAMKAIEHFQNNGENNRKLLMLKSKILYEMQKYDESLSYLDKVLQVSPDEFIASYYKAKINYELKNYAEAALSFEQALQGVRDPELVNSAVFYLGNIKIRERDFYGALHTFERSIKEFTNADQKALHLYTEGVICLMKRKLDEGVQIFIGLLKAKEPALKDFIQSIYENLGFAYFSLSKYKKAVKVFASASKISKLDKSSEFNLLVSEGILAYQNKLQAKSLKCFKQAKTIFPKNPMPELLRACILMHQSFKSNEYLHMLIKAELLIDNLNKTREPESEIMFCRSILKLCLKNYEVAYESIKKAIEKADENIAKHYIHRAFCNALLKKYEDAVQDFTISIQLNSDLPAIYIYRGISAYLQDDLQQAFDDFTTLAKNKPNDLPILLKLANLLSMVGSYQDSLSILESFSGKSADIDYFRARNYLLEFKLEKSMEILQKIPENTKLSQKLIVDKEVITMILDLKEDSSRVKNYSSISELYKDREGFIFTKKYLFWLIGVVLYYNQNFSSSSSYFQAVLEILHSEEPEVFADSITIEEENCEILYNLALCSFSSSNPELSSQALLIFEELAEVLNTKHKGQLLLLSAISELKQKNKSKAEKILKEAFKCDGETVGPFLKNQPTQVLPLHSQSELASVFPLFLIQVPDLPAVYLKPSIVLPRVCLDVKIDDIVEIVAGFFKVDSVGPRAEAPWLIRNKGSIQFTENLIEVPSDLMETEKSIEVQEVQVKGSKSRSQFLRKFKSLNVVREKSLILDKSEVENEEVELNIKFICND